MTKISLVIIFLVLILGVGGVGYQQLQITRLSERLNQEENCNFALTLLSRANNTEESDSPQVDQHWIELGNQLSKRINENNFWFFPDVTMKEVGLGDVVKDASSDQISFQNYYSSHNFFSDGMGIWFGMIKMWDTSWRAKDGTTAIVVSDVVNNNCKN
jgi:hypothetical protein|tara:strand:- start:266 stop:739 length:474 start_codon:yes stop_codon:yes gene_type:complete